MSDTFKLHTRKIYYFYNARKLDRNTCYKIDTCPYKRPNSGYFFFCLRSTLFHRDNKLSIFMRRKFGHTFVFPLKFIFMRARRKNILRKNVTSLKLHSLKMLQSESSQKRKKKNISLLTLKCGKVCLSYLTSFVIRIIMYELLIISLKSSVFSFLFKSLHLTNRMIYYGINLHESVIVLIVVR